MIKYFHCPKGAHHCRDCKDLEEEMVIEIRQKRPKKATNKQMADAILEFNKRESK